MIKTLTASTFEIDDHKAALAEILEQINPQKNLLKNSVGFITCYTEFIDNGLATEISKALPFNVMGITTFATAVNGQMGHLMLSLVVLTSDSVDFSSAATEPLAAGKVKEQLEDAYKKASAGRDEKPAMMMVMLPRTLDISGDDIVRDLNEISGGVPMFGGVAISDDPNYEDQKSFFNQTVDSGILSVSLFYGDINPLFRVGNVSEENVLSQKAIVTSSQANKIITVNNIPVLEYLESVGVVTGGDLISYAGLVLLVDYNDGTRPAARVIIDQTPEGHIICAGNVPENTILSIGSMNYNEVLSVSKSIMNDNLKSDRRNGMLVFSCLARNSALGMNVDDEMIAVEDIVAKDIPFFMAYSGGEICPFYDNNGKPVNRLHNDTIITCIF